MSKRIVKTINTPKGELAWVFITGEGKEDLNGNPRYSASVYFPKDSKEFAKYQADVMAFWEENKPKSAKKPKSIGIYLEVVELNPQEGEAPRTTVVSITQPYDKDEYKETGRVAVQAWTGTKNRDGSAKRLKVANAKGAEVSLGSKIIGNGSEGRLATAMQVYENGPNVGVSLYLNGVQLTKFVEMSSGVTFEADDDVDEDSFTGFDDSMEAFEEVDQPTTAAKVRI